MVEIVVADIGGTHARFAIGLVTGASLATIGDPVTLKTSDYRSLGEAWHAFARRSERTLPTIAAIAIAGPVRGERLKLTNNDWVIDAAALREELGLETVRLINDFGAVGHAVSALPESAFDHLCGPAGPLPTAGVVTVLGPGTGLGVAQVVRADGNDIVVETEGGHIGFAPVDEVEDRILALLRARYGRVSVERLLQGSGLPVIHEALTGEREGELALWQSALAGEDRAAASLDLYCRILGCVAGDLALAHGSVAVVIAGGLGRRLASHLPHSAFADRFVDKGRYRQHQADIPVKLVTHPEPGLFGAGVAAAQMLGDQGQLR